jgi:hypothetical protein
VYQLINTKLFFVFVSSVFGEKFPTGEFLIISAETPCWEKERK